MMSLPAPPQIVSSPAPPSIVSEPWFLSDLELARDPRFADQYEMGVRVDQVVLKNVIPPDAVKADGRRPAGLLV